MPDFATRYWGHQYEVIRRGPGGETRHKAWALDVLFLHAQVALLDAALLSAH